MWHGHPGFWCFGFFFFLIFILFIVRMIFFRRFRGCRRGWADDARTLLEKRLVNGEITVEEYQKLKEVLKK